MAVITTGQITVFDQNDVAPVVSSISASAAIMQVYSKNNGIAAYNPDWAASPLVLTANVYSDGFSIAANASIAASRIWSLSYGGASIGTGATYTVNANLADGAVPVTYYFRATYTDTATGLDIRIDASITLSVVATGSNAVYVQLSGQDKIYKSDTSTKNVCAIKAVLQRSSGPDPDNLTYRWYTIASNGTATHLRNNVAAGTFGIKSTALASEPTGAVGELGAATFTTAGVTADGTYTTAGSPGYNTLVIGEAGVSGLQVFKVEVKDTTETTVYVAYFTVTDVSDNYQLNVKSSNGDRLMNGLGSTTLTATVNSGGPEIASYTNWVFEWYMYNKVGARVGFVASASPPTPTTMIAIASNTNSTTGVLLSTSTTLPAGALVKLVSADGSIVKFAQVTGGTSATVTLQAATGDNANCNPVTTIGATEFASGKLYLAASKITTTTTRTLSITEHDIDVKGTVLVDATRP